MSHVWPLFAYLCSLALLAAPGLAWAEGIESGEAVESGRQALGGRADYPWYDRSADSVRPINLGEEPQPRQAKNITPTRGASGLGSVAGSALQGLGLTLLVALLVAIAVLIARAALNQEASGESGAHVVETSRDVDRVENLPFQMKRPAGDFLSEARRLYEAGLYSEAIVYLFSHQLVELDKHHVIRLAKGKTNRQYLREMRHRPALRGMLEPTMIAFEDVFFGHHPLDRERFEACWRPLEAFQQELLRVEQAAA